MFSIGCIGPEKAKDVSVFCLAGGWALRMTMINSLISFARTVSWMQGQVDHTCCLVQLLSTLNAPQPKNMLVSFQDYSTWTITSHPLFWLACYPMAAFLSDCFTRSYPIVQWKNMSVWSTTQFWAMNSWSHWYLSLISIFIICVYIYIYGWRMYI